MQNKHFKSVAGTVLVVLVLAIFTPATGRSQAGAGRLEGTWDVQLTLRNCDTGTPIAGPFPELATFMSGGTMLDSTSAIKPPFKTPGHGVWNHVNGDTYAFKFKNFNFDMITGQFSGWTVVSQDVVLSQEADAYSSAGTAEFYDAAGNFLRRGCSTTTATRFQ